MKVNIHIIQYISIAGSLLFVLMLFYLVRKKEIREEYSILWFFFGMIFLIFSFWRDGLALFASLIGIAYPPAAFFLILIIAILFILIQFSIVLSKLTEKNKDIIQEIGLLKQELQKINKKKVQ